MKKAIKTCYLPPREKQYPASLMDIGLQRWCKDMYLQLGLDLHVCDLNIHHRNTRAKAASNHFYQRNT